jgi:hypothetical protein
MHGLLHVLHHFEQLITRLIEVDAFSFATEESRGSAEVAPQWASNGGDDGGCRVARIVGNPHSEYVHAEAGKNFGMQNGSARSFAEIATHPTNALATHDEIGINEFVEAGDGGDVPPDDDFRFGRQAPDPAAHFANLAEVGDNTGDAHNVVLC